jgi:hypothetical protein
MRDENEIKDQIEEEINSSTLSEDEKEMVERIIKRNHELLKRLAEGPTEETPYEK